MAESIAQPNALDLTGNVAENWRYFKQEFELYLVAAGLDTKPDKQKVALLLHVAMKPAIDVYNTFTFAGAEDTTYASVLHKFDAYCNPKTNETYERYIFYMRNQQQRETVEQFVTDLKLKAKTCAFGDMSDSMIRDRIVLGIASQRVRERLLREDNLNLANAVKICQAAEATQRQITTLGNDALDTHNSSVHYCKTKGRGQYKPRKQPNEAQRGLRQHTINRKVVTVARPIHRESVEPTTRLATTVESWGTSPKYVGRLKLPKAKYGTSVRTYTKRLTARVSVTFTSGW